MAECRRLAFQVSEEEVARARNQVDGSVLNFVQYVSAVFFIPFFYTNTFQLLISCLGNWIFIEGRSAWVGILSIAVRGEKQKTSALWKGLCQGIRY